MAEKLTASSSEFVIRLSEDADLEGLRKEFADLGSLEGLPSHPGHAVFRIREGDAGKDPKWVWEELQRSLGAKGDVLPVFRDSEDTPRYPLGPILIRFKDSPSDTALTQWAQSVGLQVSRRNKYISSQVAFEPALPRTQYLPELIERLQGQDAIAAVWPETLSAYRR